MMIELDSVYRQMVPPLRFLSSCLGAASVGRSGAAHRVDDATTTASSSGSAAAAVRPYPASSAGRRGRRRSTSSVFRRRSAAGEAAIIYVEYVLCGGADDAKGFVARSRSPFRRRPLLAVTQRSAT